MHLVSLVLLFSQLVPNPSATGRVAGTVVDAHGGEILAGVAVSLNSSSARLLTDSAGHFRLDGLAAGDYVLNVAAVGYHITTRSLHVDGGATTELNVVLSPESFHQSIAVESSADPFEPSHADSPSALVLGGNDMKNLGSVIADDPLRSVQSLPGVSADNDFDARF